VNAYRIGAKVLAGDGWAAQGTLPSWKYEEFSRTVASIGLELTLTD